MRREPSYTFFYSHGLTLAFLGLTLLSLLGHAWSGWLAENDSRALQGLPGMSLVAYLGSSDFLSSLFENWESEFLQMGSFVLLTVWLRQRGSSESRPLDPADDAPRKAVPLEEQPWPARRGGWVLRLYEHSLSIALLGLFLASFLAHFLSSWATRTQEQVLRGITPDTAWGYVTDAQFWFESFQNWQSEFLSVVVLCLLSIYLREADSPQSKAVTARHSDTGAD